MTDRPPRFGQSARYQAWPDGFTFYHKPELPPFEFADLALTPDLAEQIRQAAQLYRALKRAVPSKDATVARASKARHKLRVAKTLKWRRAWRAALLRADPEMALTEIREHAAALADLLPAKGAAESVFTALQVKGLDPGELTAWLHIVEGEAAAAWERQRNKGLKPKAVAEFAFIGRLVEVYEAAGGEIRAVHDVKAVEGQGTELPDTLWVRFLLVAFNYAGARLPSSSTINRAVSEACREKQ